MPDFGSRYAVAAYLDGLMQFGDRMIRLHGADKDDVLHEITFLINMFAELNDPIKSEMVLNCSNIDKRNKPYHIGGYSCWLELNTDSGALFCVVCDD